jgi:hypothetical protein
MAIDPLVTALLALAVFTLGQLVLKLFIEPVIALRARIGTVASDLVLHAQRINSPADCPRSGLEDAAALLRLRAAQLSGDTYAVVSWWFFVATGWIPRRENCLNAASNLIGLSNAVLELTADRSQRHARDIRLALRLPNPDEATA